MIHEKESLDYEIKNFCFVQATVKVLKRQAVWKDAQKITNESTEIPLNTIRVTKSRVLTMQNAGKEPQECSLMAAGNAEWGDHFGKEFGSFLQCQRLSYHRSNNMST
jgi:hypothetical protein